MLNIEEINKTIAELEQGTTTFANCAKLADLYIVKEHYKDSGEKWEKSKKEEMTEAQKMAEKQQKEVVSEYSDILPQYQHYCEVKRKYQLNEATEQAVLNCMANVCTEIKEFIATLYNTTEMPEERKKLNVVIKWLYDQYAEEEE